MTIQFVGHVISLTGSGATMDVKIATPVSSCLPRELVLSIPRESASAWLPGRMVQFTAYTLPEPNQPIPESQK